MTIDRRRVSPRALAASAAAGLLLVTVGCAVPQPAGEGKLSRIVEPTTRRGYYLYLPKDYVQADDAVRRLKRWPLVVTFHGMKPFDTATAQSREWQQEADRYGYVVVAPFLKAPHVFGQFPLHEVTPALQSDEDATIAILDHVFATTDADRGNVLSTSWSSGGYMAHYMMNRHPERFSALAVRQSNFTAQVMDPANAERCRYHPILIAFTKNDFAICKRESREAVQWYHEHGYKNVWWVEINALGHERTPDLAADFFGRVAGAPPSVAPVALTKRQAIDGNPEGLALLAGQGSELRSRPAEPAGGTASARLALARRTDASAGAGPAAGSVTPARRLPPPSDNVAAALPPPPRTSERRSGAPSPAAASSGGAGPPKPAPVRIRVSSAIGIEPLHLGFWAECPQDWVRTADFLWTLDGDPIGNGVNGQKTLTESGEHALGLLVINNDGQEHRTSRLIRVLPRLEKAE